MYLALLDRHLNHLILTDPAWFSLKADVKRHLDRLPEDQWETACYRVLRFLAPSVALDQAA